MRSRSTVLHLLGVRYETLHLSAGIAYCLVVVLDTYTGKAARMSNPVGSGSSSDPLVEMGWRKIWWAERHMRLLKRLREEFERTQPFAGMTIGMCIHVEPKTAVLCGVLRAGGAQLVITGSPGTSK